MNELILKQRIELALEGLRLNGYMHDKLIPKHLRDEGELAESLFKSMLIQALSKLSNCCCGGETCHE